MQIHLLFTYFILHIYIFQVLVNFAFWFFSNFEKYLAVKKNKKFIKQLKGT